MVLAGKCQPALLALSIDYYATPPLYSDQRAVVVDDELLEAFVSQRQVGIKTEAGVGFTQVLATSSCRSVAAHWQRHFVGMCFMYCHLGITACASSPTAKSVDVHMWKYYSGG